MKWCYQVVYTKSTNSGTATYSSGAFSTHEEMEQDRAQLLDQIGWTPPRWWQWWRLHDSPRTVPLNGADHV